LHRSILYNAAVGQPRGSMRQAICLVEEIASPIRSHREERSDEAIFSSRREPDEGDCA